MAPNKAMYEAIYGVLNVHVLASCDFTLRDM